MKERFYSALQRPGADPSREEREMYVREKRRERKGNKTLMSRSCCLWCSHSHTYSEPWCIQDGIELDNADTAVQVVPTLFMV